MTRQNTSDYKPRHRGDCPDAAKCWLSLRGAAQKKVMIAKLLAVPIKVSLCDSKDRMTEKRC